MCVPNCMYVYCVWKYLSRLMRTLDCLERLPNVGIELGFSARTARGIFPALVLWVFFWCVCCFHLLLFYMHTYLPACMLVCHVYAYFPRRSETLVKMLVRHWGIKPRLCGRAACPLNCWAISSSYNILNIYYSLILQHICIKIAFIIILMYFSVCLESIYENCR